MTSSLPNFCPGCGIDLREEPSVQAGKDARFCPRCGHPLGGGSPSWGGGADSSLEEKILQHLREGRYIEAVKEFRRAHSTSLRESKEAVDAIARQYGMRTGSAAMSAKGRFIWLMILSAFLGLIVASIGLAVFPRLGMIAGPMLCGGEVRLRSEQIESPPGYPGYTVGISRSFECPDGKSVNGRVFLISFLAYTGIILLLFYAWRLIVRPLRGEKRGRGFR